MASHKSQQQWIPTEKGSLALAAAHTSNNIPKTSQPRPSKAKSPKKSTKRREIASKEDKDESESDQSVSEHRHTMKKKAGKHACHKNHSPKVELMSEDKEGESLHTSKDDDDRSHSDSEESVVGSCHWISNKNMLA
ncbi:hypothetical protein BDR04DRAFT_1164728 [Suillus decipiens]|nr:hypothetical protein BDR04DRAFT_1164728 [Suillus decipiens]